MSEGVPVSATNCPVHKTMLPCNDCERSGALGPLVQETVSATDNYMPDTDEVRSGYRGYWRSQSIVGQVADAEFDRWLATERAKARQEAFEEAAKIAELLAQEERHSKGDWQDVYEAAVNYAAEVIRREV